MSGAGAASALAFGPGFLRAALASPAQPGASPYGDLQPPNELGLMLPEHFTGRQIARGQTQVGDYLWHPLSDGQATYRTKAGGSILVSNSESLAATGAGSSAIRFAPDGSIERAYRILGGTNLNCAGGPTPWGTWLSCEEHEGGMVWEADPAGLLPPVPRPALGNFAHEAAAVDRDLGHVYLTEDQAEGGFYRFTPDEPGNLASGLLEVAVVDPSTGSVSWREVPDPNVITGAAMTRRQVPEMTRFNGGEGLWFDAGIVYFTTKGDKKVWAYDTATRHIETIFDRALAPTASLDAVDNVTVSAYGDVYVCEDGGNMEIGIITPDSIVAAFCRLVGPEHTGSEMCGVVFDPSGTRMYFSSQRAYQYVSGTTLADGAIYEVQGPFRLPPGGVPESKVFGPPAGEQLDELPGLGVPGLVARYERGVARVVLRAPATVDVVLRTADLRKEHNPRWLESRPVLTTLARARVSLGRGEHTIPLATAVHGVSAILTARAGDRVVASRIEL